MTEDTATWQISMAGFTVSLGQNQRVGEAFRSVLRCRLRSGRTGVSKMDNSQAATPEGIPPNGRAAPDTRSPGQEQPGLTPAPFDERLQERFELLDPAFGHSAPHDDP